MANVTYQLGQGDEARPQTQSGIEGAADVHVASGMVGINPTVNLVRIGVSSSASDATITTGGTAQNIFAGLVPTNGFAIYNPDSTNDLWISDSATALTNGLGSIRVASNGGWYETPVGYKPNHSVSIVGAVTGQKITARSW
jgi:hypothetical protein